MLSWGIPLLDCSVDGLLLLMVRETFIGGTLGAEFCPRYTEFVLILQVKGPPHQIIKEY